MIIDRVPQLKNEYAASERSFGIVFSILFLFIGLYPLVNDMPIRFWSLGICFSFLIITALLPNFLKPLNFLWGKLGFLLSKIMSPVILGALYLIVIVPVGLFLRLFRIDLLKLRQGKDIQSHWVKRDSSEEIINNLPYQF